MDNAEAQTRQFLNDALYRLATEDEDTYSFDQYVAEVNPVLEADRAATVYVHTITLNGEEVGTTTNLRDWFNERGINFPHVKPFSLGYEITSRPSWYQE